MGRWLSVKDHRLLLRAVNRSGGVSGIGAQKQRVLQSHPDIKIQLL